MNVVSKLQRRKTKNNMIALTLSYLFINIMGKLKNCMVDESKNVLSINDFNPMKQSNIDV